MSFAKLPTQAPQWDATAWAKVIDDAVFKTTGKHLPPGLIPWKRWTEASSEFDVTGLRDVVNANALGLNAVKSDVDGQATRFVDVEMRLTALEKQPPVPFPASGHSTASG